MTTPTLFLSGAGLPAWIWDDVRAALDVESRVVDHPRGTAGLADYADAALGTADGWDGFHVVAHSIGGVVASELVARAPQRVRGLTAVSACIPAAGSSFLASLPAPQRWVVGLLMRVLGTKPPAKEIRDGLCLGASAEQAERIVAEFAPESQRLYRDAVSARTFPAGTRYVVTTRDTQFAPALQHTYAAELGADVSEIATAHLPMLEDPATLVAALRRPAG